MRDALCSLRLQSHIPPERRLAFICHPPPPPFILIFIFHRPPPRQSNAEEENDLIMVSEEIEKGMGCIAYGQSL